MFSRDDLGPFAACDTLAEIFVVANHTDGLAMVDALLTAEKAIMSRECLQRAADEIARVGMRDLARLIRSHAKKTKSEPMTSFKRRWADKIAADRALPIE